MNEECDNFEAEEGYNVCEHFCGDVFVLYQCVKCSEYCSLALMKDKSEIDVGRCSNG